MVSLSIHVVAVCVACFWEERQVDPEPHDWNKLEGWDADVRTEKAKREQPTEDWP